MRCNHASAFPLHRSWLSADLQHTLLQVLPVLAFGAIYLALSSPATTYGFLKAVFGCEYTACCLSTHHLRWPLSWHPGQQQYRNPKNLQIRERSTMSCTGTGFLSNKL